MSHFPRSLIGAAVAAVLATPTITWAQTADATLRGSAPASADITAKNVATGATRRTKADANGNYVLVGLTPGTYRVDAGAGTEQVVTVTVASTATLDLGGAGAAASDEPMTEVTVTGRRLREVRTSEVGTTVSIEQIENVPQMSRNFLEFADTVPGVVFQIDSKGSTSVKAGAQGADAVNVYIDGVGQKGYVRAGQSGQNDGTQGNPFPQLAIGEYKVITSNYKAEYDQISSAAITAQTRSGTNQFEGQAFGTYSADNFRARTPGERTSGTKTPSETKEYGLAFGGPIMQDRMHFFGTYEAKRYVTPITIVTGEPSTPPAILAQLPADVQALFGPASIGFDEDLFFVKLDYELSEFDRLEFSVKLRDEKLVNNGIGAGIAPSSATNVNNNDDRYLLEWKHSGDGWFNEVQLTYEDAFFVPIAINPDSNGLAYTFELNGQDGQDRGIITLNGADPRAGQNKGQKGWAIANTITFPDVAGAHTIKAGIKYKDIELTAADAQDYPPLFAYDVTEDGVGADPWRAVFSLAVPGFDSIVRSDAKQLGLFVQDDWEINDKLTLNLGIRYDREKNPSFEDFVTPQFFIDAMNALVDIDPNPDDDIEVFVPYRDTLNASDDPNVRVNIDDYISTGNNRSANGDVAPRLGFSYDLFADQDHVIFGGAGRAYDRNLYDRYQLEQTKFALSTFTAYFNLADTDPSHGCNEADTECLAWNPAYLTDRDLLVSQFNGAVGEVIIFNNDLKTPYSDQYTLGMRNRIGDWNTSASVSRILSYDGVAFTMGIRRRNGEFWEGGGQPWGFNPPGTALMMLGDNGQETRNTQIALSAEKPFTEDSKWGATIAYTYNDAKTNVDGVFSFNESSLAGYDFIQAWEVAKHRFVATGTYQLPWQIKVAGKFTWSSPLPAWFNQCANGQLWPDGAFCTPYTYDPGGTGYQALDLQITKDFQLGDLGSMYLRFDVLNVFNRDNLVDYQGGQFDENGMQLTARYNPNGNITGFPRTLRASFGFKF